MSSPLDQLLPYVTRYRGRFAFGLVFLVLATTIQLISPWVLKYAIDDLTLGATRLKSLAWRVTGFTIGHSVTLSAGFFGFVPSGAWFVPAVETGIALSIIYAAAIAVTQRAEPNRSERTLFFVTSAIGLLHGLGFSFVLHKILQVDSPNLWQSLLAFNVGVEIGQLIIIVAAWPAFRLIQRSSENVWRASRIGISTTCIAVAAVWTWQRALSVIGSL